MTERPPWKAEHGEPKPRRAPRIILVDDDADLLAVLRAWLGPDCATLLLPDGKELVAAALAFRPDLVVLDVSLPGLDGYRLCRRLRREEALRSVPVLFLSGRASDAAFLGRLRSGGDGWLRKPAEKEEFLRHVSALLPPE